MRRIKQAKPSAAMIVAVVALVAALGGGAVAGVAVTSLNKKDKKQVTKIAKKQGKKQAKTQIGKQFPVESFQIANGAVGGPQIASNSIDDSKLTQIDLFGSSFVSAPLSDQTDKDFALARAAAPKVPLYSKGQLSVYGKCFATDSFESYAIAAVETTAAGSILAANDSVDPGSGKTPKTPWLDGDPDFLNPSTDEGDRIVGQANEGAGSLRSHDVVRSSFTAMSPDGTAVDGLMSIAIGGSGVFGSDEKCLFTGFGVG